MYVYSPSLYCQYGNGFFYLFIFILCDCPLKEKANDHNNLTVSHFIKNSNGREDKIRDTE